MFETVIRNGTELKLYIDYHRDDSSLRKSMGSLCQATYGFDFEAAHRQLPLDERLHFYTLFHEHRAVSHITVTEQDFRLGFHILRLAQLGTVMIREEYRGRGLSRLLMERVLRDFEGKDALFLFANRAVSGFYPRFGFAPAAEYPRVVRPDVRNRLREQAGLSPAARKLDLDCSTFRRMLSLSRTGGSCYFYPINNQFLTGFYLKAFPHFSTAGMLWEIPGWNAIAIAERDGERLIIHDLLADRYCPLKVWLPPLITRDVREVELRLALNHPWLQQVREEDPDNRLFLRGPAADLLAGANIVFPTTAHT